MSEEEQTPNLPSDITYHKDDDGNYKPFCVSWWDDELAGMTPEQRKQVLPKDVRYNEKKNLVYDLPICDRCDSAAVAAAWLPANITTRFHNTPPWCAACLEEGDWDEYWLERVKYEYKNGRLQS